MSTHSSILYGPPYSSDAKASACNAGDPGSIPGSGRSPGEENGYRLQYSCLENAMDRTAWQTTGYSPWISRIQTQLSYQQHLMLAVKFSTST